MTKERCCETCEMEMMPLSMPPCRECAEETVSQDGEIFPAWKEKGSVDYGQQ